MCSVPIHFHRSYTEGIEAVYRSFSFLSSPSWCRADYHLVNRGEVCWPRDAGTGKPCQGRDGNLRRWLVKLVYELTTQKLLWTTCSSILLANMSNCDVRFSFGRSGFVGKATYPNDVFFLLEWWILKAIQNELTIPPVLLGLHLKVND